MKTLVWVEHDGTAVKDATLSAVTAAAQLGEVHLLVAGHSVDDFPPERVMSPDDLVVASLRALELGEPVCIPALPDIADWDALVAAEAKIGPNASSDRIAARYHG